MPIATLGKKVPAFKVPATGNTPLTHQDLRAQLSILYFYPKDNTPGCTQEGHDFRDHHAAFKKLGAAIYGVSRDTLTSHEKFKIKHAFPFELIADSEETLCVLFDVIQMKNLYGKKVLGIERSTFLIDQEGVLQQAWRKVKVKGHVEEVLAAVKTFNRA
ncbi:MAG: peroxiredoxin [Gammaproteobacteria bacterium]|nr:peroxiredoxin [Gammaproteobacteria bacterium]